MNKEQERSEKYGCNGRCYTSTQMCPRVEFCPKTRDEEFAATMIAVTTVIFAPIVAAIGIVLVIF